MNLLINNIAFYIRNKDDKTFDTELYIRINCTGNNKSMVYLQASEMTQYF